MIQRYFFSVVKRLYAPAEQFEIDYETDEYVLEWQSPTVEIFVEDDLMGQIRYKGSFAPIIAGTDTVQMVRLKYDGDYPVFGLEDEVKLYILPEHKSDISDAVIIVTADLGTFDGYEGNGWMRFKFNRDVVTTDFRGVWSYRILWTHGTDLIQISRPKEVIEIV